MKQSGFFSFIKMRGGKYSDMEVALMGQPRPFNVNTQTTNSVCISNDGWDVIYIFSVVES